MEKLATGIVFLERSSGTKLRTGISFGSVILTNQDAVAVVAVFARVATPSALNRMGVGEKRVAHPSKTEMEGHPRGFCELNAPPADGLPSCQ